MSVRGRLRSSNPAEGFLGVALLQQHMNTFHVRPASEGGDWYGTVITHGGQASVAIEFGQCQIRGRGCARASQRIEASE